MTPRELLKAIAEKDAKLRLESHAFPGITHHTVLLGNRGLAYWDGDGEPVENGLMSYCLEEMRAAECNPQVLCGKAICTGTGTNMPDAGNPDWEVLIHEAPTPHEAVYRLYLAYLEKKLWTAKTSA